MYVTHYVQFFTMSYVLCMGYVPSGHAKDLGCTPRSAAAGIRVSWYIVPGRRKRTEG